MIIYIQAIMIAEDNGNPESARAARQVVVVGGGPAGLIAAGEAAKAGASTILLEKKKQTGRKLAITGKGRCNLTNIAPLPEFVAHFRPNGRFLRHAFYRFFSPDLIEFFEELNVVYRTNSSSGNSIARARTSSRV